MHAGIAQLIRMGWFRPAHAKSIGAQEIRALLVARKQLLGRLIDVELRIRVILRGFGLKVGSITRKNFEVRIRELATGQAMLERIGLHAGLKRAGFDAVLLETHCDNGPASRPIRSTAKPSVSKKPNKASGSLSSSPSRSFLVHPQCTRSMVPKTRRFRHTDPWLSSVSRCLGPTQRRDPVSSSIGGQPPSPPPRSEQGPLRHLASAYARHFGFALRILSGYGSRTRFRDRLAA